MLNVIPKIILTDKDGEEVNPATITAFLADRLSGEINPVKILSIKFDEDTVGYDLEVAIEGKPPFLMDTAAIFETKEEAQEWLNKLHMDEINHSLDIVTRVIDCFKYKAPSKSDMKYIEDTILAKLEELKKEVKKEQYND